jgi:hypothetical protein
MEMFLWEMTSKQGYYHQGFLKSILSLLIYAAYLCSLTLIRGLPILNIYRNIILENFFNHILLKEYSISTGDHNFTGG